MLRVRRMAIDIQIHLRNKSRNEVSIAPQALDGLLGSFVFRFPGCTDGQGWACRDCEAQPASRHTRGRRLLSRHKNPQDELFSRLGEER